MDPLKLAKVKNLFEIDFTYSLIIISSIYLDDSIRIEPPNPNEIRTEHHLKIARNVVDNLKLLNDSIKQ